MEAKDLSRLVPLPSLVGGSLLEAAENDFDNLYAALRGLVGQHISSSIDEVLLSMNLSDTTKEQRAQIVTNTAKMLTAMKARAEKQVSDGVYATSRTFNFIPTWNEKQLTQISNLSSGSNGQNLGVEDVLFHAKKLAGTLGTDISMLGFADQLSGGLGDGGLIDGLQHGCSTVVFGELDWSPGVHEQCIGRVHRDGQQDPVMAYFLISDEGSDPIVSDVLGVKREQIEGVRNPDDDLIQRLDVGGNKLRDLAQKFLKDNNVLPDVIVPTPIRRDLEPA